MTLGRAAGPERSAVGPIELFFDLVYVFAIVQISHLLISDLSWRGFAQTAVVFAAIWWGWNYTAWMMNWLDPARGAVQLLNAVLMLLALGMAAAIPLAFDGGGVLFVACYVAMGLIRPLFMMIAFRGPWRGTTGSWAPGRRRRASCGSSGPSCRPTCGSPFGSWL